MGPLENLAELAEIAKKADIILKEELKKARIPFDLAEASVYNAKTVGVQGDEKTYAYPVEITLFSQGTFVWQPEFLAGLSNRLTNEIPDINRVAYVLATKS